MSSPSVEGDSQFPTQFRARVVPAGGGVGEIQRMGPLTHESVQALLDDSRLVGRGARLEIRLLEPVVGPSRAWLDGLAKSVRRRGVSFALHSEHEQASWSRPAARAAA